MSETSQDDKTEKATPYKLREARKKGQVAKSQELSGWLSMFLFTLAFSPIFASLCEQFSQQFGLFFGAYQQLLVEPEILRMWGSEVLLSTLKGLSIMFAFIILIAILANLLQVGFVFSFEAIKPDLNRINPVAGAKKIFSKKMLFELVKSLLKIIILMFLIMVGISHFYDTFFYTDGTEAMTLAGRFISLVSQCVLLVLMMLLPITLMDLVYVRRDFANKMKMSKRELKDENKRNEGNPEIKGKRRELQKSLAKSAASLNQVKEADLIITNPTHYAVALKYDASKVGLPVVVSKGKGEMAAKIRALARKYSKPVLRRPPLARLLYKLSDIDQAIPQESFREVAQVYNWLFKLKGKQK